MLLCSSSSSATPQPTPTPGGNNAAALERLRGAAPFFIDAALVAPEVSYSGPLARAEGADAYLALQRSWARDLPSRLVEWRLVEPPQLFAFEPGTVRLRWSASFTAAIPPPAKSRGLPADMEVLPGDRVRVRADFQSELRLDSAGRITAHYEGLAPSMGYDIPSTIARYEVLMARRTTDLPPLWYFKVLKSTTFEETSALADDELSTDALEQSFRAMVRLERSRPDLTSPSVARLTRDCPRWARGSGQVVRNFSLGLLLGIVVFFCIKLLQLWFAELALQLLV